MFDSYSSWRDLLIAAGALVAMTGFGLAALLGITLLLARFLNDTVSAAILAGAAPIVATFSLGIWNDYREGTRADRREQFRGRAEAYESFLEFLYDAIRRLDDPDQPNDLLLSSEQYEQFLQDLMAWGSDELIELWNEFRHVDLEDLDRENQREWFARLLEQVRGELRGDSSELDGEELYDLYSLESSEDS